MKRLTNNRDGMALVVAIGLALFISSTVAWLLWRSDGALRRLDGAIGRSQAREAAKPALALIASSLADTETAPGEKTPFTPPDPLFPDGLSFDYAVHDPQAAFNLNNLAFGGVANEPVIATFRRLLETIDIDPAFAESITDWVDTDDSPRRFGGAEGDDYVDYAIPDGIMATAEEALLAKGADARLFDSPFVTALPKPSPVNVNHAAPQLLRALFGGLRDYEAEDLAHDLADDPADDLDDLLRRVPRLTVTAPANLIAFTSRFVVIRLTIGVERRRYRFDALYEFPDKGEPRKIWMRAA